MVDYKIFLWSLCSVFVASGLSWLLNLVLKLSMNKFILLLCIVGLTSSFVVGEIAEKIDKRG